MKTIAGVWIDHRKAVIAIVSEGGEESQEIRSHVEKHLSRIDGVRSTEPFEAQLVNADDSHEREYTGHLNPYYARVVDAIRHVDTVLIFGPGEAKGELKRHLEHAKYSGKILPMEITDKMSNPQILAKVREHTQHVSL